jgi:hypothetical protein
MNIKKNDGTPATVLGTLAAYFRKSDETLQEFKKQVDQLSPADKEELAVGAAKEMNWTVEGA